MKKIILIVCSLIVLASCNMNKFNTEGQGIAVQNFNYNLEKITFEGHEYLKFKQPVYAGWSIAVVHSASCPCHNKEEQKNMYN